MATLKGGAQRNFEGFKGALSRYLPTLQKARCLCIS